jgi:hypothetical protein
LNVAVTSKDIWNRTETNSLAVLRKTTKYLSAEFGDNSESEVEIGRKWKIHIQEEQSAT